MIKQITAALKQVFIPKSELEEDECSMDEEKVAVMDTPPYMGVPAPAYLEKDPWFSIPVLSEKQEDLRAELEEENLLIAEQEDQSPVKEVANIHEVMYNIATSGGNTTVQLDPVGGSENFQSGPGGWMSGTGMSQFN